MKSVLAKDLLQYKFLSGVKAAPHTDRAAFVVSKANEGDNGYDSSIYLYEKGKTRRLTAMDKERSFLWENDTTLLFPALRSQQDKKRQEAGEIFTAFYRLSIDGGEAEKAFELPLACGLPEPLSDTLYYVTASIDTDCPDYWKLSKKAQEAYRAKKKAGEDYRILTHNPWWFNNAGFVEGQG